MRAHWSPAQYTWARSQQSSGWLRRRTNHSHTGSHDHTTAVDPLNINRRDTGELRWRLNVISPSLFFDPRFTLAPEKDSEKLDMIYLKTAIATWVSKAQGPSSRSSFEAMS